MVVRKYFPKSWSKRRIQLSVGLAVFVTVAAPEVPMVLAAVLLGVCVVVVLYRRLLFLLAGGAAPSLRAQTGAAAVTGAIVGIFAIAPVVVMDAGLGRLFRVGLLVMCLAVGALVGAVCGLLVPAYQPPAPRSLP